MEPMSESAWVSLEQLDSLATNSPRWKLELDGNADYEALTQQVQGLIMTVRYRSGAI